MSGRFKCVDCNMPVNEMQAEADHQTHSIKTEWAEFVEINEQGIPIYQVHGIHPRAGDYVDANEAVLLGLDADKIPGNFR